MDVTGKMYYIANSEWFKGSGGFVNNSPILANEQVNGKKLSSESMEIRQFGNLARHSWGTVEAQLGHSWGTKSKTLGHSWGTVGAQLGHSWGIKLLGAQLGHS